MNSKYFVIDRCLIGFYQFGLSTLVAHFCQSFLVLLVFHRIFLSLHRIWLDRKIELKLNLFKIILPEFLLILNKIINKIKR